MTRCMIRKDFFVDNSYEIQLLNPEDIADEQNGVEKTTNDILIEFCLPFTELKHIVEGMIEEDNLLQLEYPVGDNMLQIKIPEETKGCDDKITIETNIQLETYQASHTLDADYSFKNVGIAAQFFGRVHHFKKALKEFNFLEAKDIVQMQVSETYPKLSFVFQKPSHQRQHSVKFNEEVDDFVIKQTSENTVHFTIESLRLAFSRISSDSLICIVTLNNEGALSVKLMHEAKIFLTESLILSQEEDQSFN